MAGYKEAGNRNRLLKVEVYRRVIIKYGTLMAVKGRPHYARRRAYLRAVAHTRLSVVMKLFENNDDVYTDASPRRRSAPCERPLKGCFSS